VITLGEGGTPLVHAQKLSELTGSEVYLKVEGMNPTGSFKDRGMTMAMTAAVASGAKAVVCASTGNTSASAAAYATAAGLKCAVLVPEGKISMGKLSQAIAHGATLLQVDGNFDNCLDIARKLGESYPVFLVNSVNPARIQGQKTGAFEIVDALGDAPDIHVLPVGNAGNITAYWKGFSEWREAGYSGNAPRMLGFQAEGASPLVAGHDFENPETVASAIRIGSPASKEGALAASRESGGLIESVTDDEILDAQALLASEEGVFCEPASAAGIAGLLKLVREGRGPEGTVVSVLTGHGLKDPDAVLSRVELPEPVQATLEAVGERMERALR
jgi:threonine synthase